MRLAESRKQGGMASFSGVTRPKAAWERGIEPSQTPKFLPPFPWEGRRLFLVTVALSPPTPWLAAPRVVGPHEKRRPLPPLGISASFLLPYAEHPPQNGGEDGRGAQDHDLHGVPSFLYGESMRGRSLSVYASPPAGAKIFENFRRSN